MEIMLGEMAAIMDHHPHHHHGPTRPAKAPTWTTLSPTGSSGSSDDAAELFPWSNELKQTLRMRLQGHHPLSEENIASKAAEPLTPASRKRKIWDELESLEVKSLPGELATPTDLQEDPPRVFSTSNSGTLHHLSDLRPPASPIRRYVKPKTPEGVTSGRMTSWQDIDDNLAADLDGSLSGLGEDLSTASYNMSEALLALPSLTVFKQEATSPITQGNSSSQQQHQGSPPAEMDRDSPTSLHHLLHSQTLTGGENGGYHSPPSERHLSRGDVPGQHNPAGQGMGTAGQQIGLGADQNLERFQRLEKLNTTIVGEDYRFQYVLAAATSIATKVNEESLTYLNQGQSYEIKLKKLGDLSAFRGTILKSVIRICFHERRLQYMEREKLAAWRQSRPGDRIVEVDIPLSYGLWDVVQDLELLNTVEFQWDPTKEVGVYIKVNCISTEFTPKKHGGEKGVPFRIQVETYSQSDVGSIRRLHGAACQIKVFKLKGADRKHKQDREKIQKRPASEQEKYQPSYECTVLTDIASDNTVVFPVNSTCITGGVVSGFTTPIENNMRGGSPTETVKEESAPSNGAGTLPSQSAQQPSAAEFLEEIPIFMEPLPLEATASQTSQWLQSNRFGQFLRTFNSFGGADILRLTRDDMIQICGLADGIRLFNALHSKTIIPRLTLYLCQEGVQVFHALYLSSLQRSEMTSRLAELVGIPAHSVVDVYLQGPNGIHVFLTDQVVANLKDESMFSVEIINDSSGESYRLLLKYTSPQQ